MATIKDTREVTLVSSDKQEFKLSAESVKLARMVRCGRVASFYTLITSHYIELFFSGRFIPQFD